MQNKVIEYVKQYAMITLSISIMSVGVYFFKFPNNFVFGGVTGMAALAASAFSSAANMILLGVGLIFLGKKFAMTTGYATVVPGGQPHLFPVLTYGKFTEHDGKLTLPFSLSISHAAVDGWHISQFFQGMQDLLDTVELTAEG